MKCNHEIFPRCLFISTATCITIHQPYDRVLSAIRCQYQRITYESEYEEISNHVLG